MSYSLETIAYNSNDYLKNERIIRVTLYIELPELNLKDNKWNDHAAIDIFKSYSMHFDEIEICDVSKETCLIRNYMHDHLYKEVHNGVMICLYEEPSPYIKMMFNKIKIILNDESNFNNKNEKAHIKTTLYVDHYYET